MLQMTVKVTCDGNGIGGGGTGDGFGNQSFHSLG